MPDDKNKKKRFPVVDHVKKHYDEPTLTAFLNYSQRKLKPEITETQVDEACIAFQMYCETRDRRRERLRKEHELTEMKQAGPEIRAALARSAVKAMTAMAIGQGDSSGFLAFAGKLAAQLTDAADTRSWLLLPAEVHIRRLFLDPGDYTLALDSTLEAGQRTRRTTELSLQSGDIRLWQVRTLAANQAAAPDEISAPAPGHDENAGRTEDESTKPTRRLPTKD